MSTTPSTLLTAEEAIARLGKGKRTFVALVREGRLTACRFPDRALGFHPADVDAVMRPVDPREAASELEGMSSALPIRLLPAQQVVASTSTVPVVDRFHRLVQEMESRVAKTARWLPAKSVSAVFGIDKHRLEHWAAKGLVRRAKLGTAQQAKALYSTEDLDRLLDGVATGRIKPPEEDVA